ncbi:AP-5 complex subunit zeta-1-like [Pecten maximus]|uniref:AP-5 complex subunit zeta-1-like n=1 Tax=Pecten maximus TaxID=6579 RepID=UPI001458D7FF|nr:AP-5 complex subunit zeta-1-like [Pecten maximus]
MATSMIQIDNIFHQAKNATQEEIDGICSGILDSLYVPEQSGESLNLLRQLFLILHVSQTEPCLPKKFIATMVNMVSSMDREKTKECLLCEQMMTELLPRNREELGPDFYTEDERVDPKSVANSFTLYRIQGNKNKCIEKLIPQAVRWMSSENVDPVVQRQAFSFLVAMSLQHRLLLADGSIKQCSRSVSDWMMSASLQQAPNPYTRKIFKKEQNSVVTEVDGTPSRNFFTVLNIGQYYTDDQFLNIYSFSMLYKWLHHCFTVEASTSAGEKDRSDTNSASSPVHRVFDILVNKSIDYCFRILDQCDRKPKIPSDQDLQNACLLETVNVLDLVCKIDTGQISKVFQEIRRLYNRLSQDWSKSRLLLPILQFYMNHSKAVLHDPQEAYKLVFHMVLARSFMDNALMFDLVMFLRQNLEALCHDTKILTTYFPNIFKILAWNPRTYLSEFEELLPALMSPSTALEILHVLLDLPCMTIALEITERLGGKGEALTQSDTDPITSVDAFHHLFYRPMFNFFTRVEGGHGDTINRLASFHNAVKDMSQHPRVIVCSQTVPVLLRVWFEVVLEEGTTDLAAHLLPVLLERSALLYDMPDFKIDVKRILSENIVRLFKKFPQILIEEQTEIQDFITSVSNITGREEFFANMVWAVGEYCSSTHDDRCNSDVIKRFFDTLEPLTYEMSAMVSMGRVTCAEGHAKIISILMSSIAKLSSRCQDLIPRAVLCLSKVSQQQQQCGAQDPEIQDALVSRSQHLVNLLQVPNFAAVILNPSPGIHTGRWHRDSTGLPAMLRGVHRIVVSDS